MLTGGVTVIWFISSSFGSGRTQILSVLGIPTGDTQNTESLKLGQVKSSTSLLKTTSSSYEALSQEIKALYINNSLHLAGKYARIFVREHYLFRKANSFPRA